jgi:hypothetical protein
MCNKVCILCILQTGTNVYSCDDINQPEDTPLVHCAGGPDSGRHLRVLSQVGAQFRGSDCEFQFSPSSLFNSSRPGYHRRGMVRTRSPTRLAQKPVCLDVCEIVIDILASDKSDHLNSVKKCALVSQAFLPLCRKHIFATIKIGDPSWSLEPSHSDADSEGPYHTLEDFTLLIKSTPAIGNYIRYLEFHFAENDSEELDDIRTMLDDFPRALRQLTILESLAIQIAYLEEHLNWRALPWPVRNALLRLMHLPSLTTLSLCGIENFLVTDLVHGTNLRCLQVVYCTFFEDSADAPSTPIILPDKLIRLHELVIHSNTNSSGIKEITSARRSDGLPVIDAAELTSVSVKCLGLGDMHTLRTFLRRSERLTEFGLTGKTFISLLEFLYLNDIISVPLNLTFAGSGGVISPHLRALKTANFTISIDDDTDDHLGGLCGELERIAGECVLETLCITVEIHGSNDRSEAEWGILDMTLTSSGWPVLKAVFLKICLLSDQPEDYRSLLEFEQFKDLEPQFPRLLASKKLDFRLELGRVPI